MSIVTNIPDISLVAGDCLELVVTWPNMTLVTSPTAEAGLRRRNDTAIMADSAVVDTGANTITVNFENEQTEALVPGGQYLLQVRVTDSAGCKTTVVSGIVTINQSVFE